jgi:hypothetical protein
LSLEFFLWRKNEPSLDLASQPVSRPPAHASLGAENVEFVNAARLASYGLSPNELPAYLTAHGELPDKTRYLAEYIIVSKLKGEQA